MDMEGLPLALTRTGIIRAFGEKSGLFETEDENGWEFLPTIFESLLGTLQFS